jgi:hypothetical protein
MAASPFLGQNHVINTHHSGTAQTGEGFKILSLFKGSFKTLIPSLK